MAADEYTRGAIAALDALAGSFQDLAAEGNKKKLSIDDIVEAISAARSVVVNPPTQDVADLARQAARNTARGRGT